MTRIFSLISVLWVISEGAMAASVLPLVPLPAVVKPMEGSFELGEQTRLVAGKVEERQVAEWLASGLRVSSGLPLTITGDAAAKSIQFLLDPSLKLKLGREGYQLECAVGGVTIRAADVAGLFYGAQTFRQLLPPQAYGKKKAEGVKWVAPAVKIEDQPRFAWRGFSLDVSRHFFPMEKVKDLVDDMAAQKLNVLQLHLTDDDGWRIEIKKYPKLTELGAWRGTECALPNTRPGETFQRYGGFYTQEQLKELVAYAKVRNVEIMPEIDLPGHALAIVTAYPETLPSKLNDAVSTQGHKANAISPVKEENYRMIDEIIGEVAAIFPFSYIHIGGDEVNHKIWEACPEIRALMEKEKLQNLHQVQVHFTKRLEGILAKHQRRMIGWQEIADGRLDRGTGIMAWISAGPGWEAARRGSPAVFAPGGNCYFDMPYPGAEDEPPSHWWAGPVGLARAYEFDPLPESAKLDAAASKQVLGVHAALWTEFVKGWTSKSGWLELKDEGECAEYKIWPRLCATAETGWTPQNRRDFADFSTRMGVQFVRMAEVGRKFRVEPPVAKLKNGKIFIQAPWPGAKIRFTTDGTDPFASKTAVMWDGKPLDGRFRSGLAMRTTMPEYRLFSPLTKGAVVDPAGSWEVSGWPKGKTTQLSYDVSDHVSDAGRWKVRLQKTKGSEGLVVEGVELRVAGKVLASATTEKGRAVLEFERLPAGKLELVVSARFNGEKPDARGAVLIEKLNGIRIPGLRVETKIPAYGDDHATASLLDGDSETYFWSSRNLEKDEGLTWVLPQPMKFRSVELQTGQPNGTKDQILDAVLEVSENGKDFTSVSGFQYGAAKAELAGKMIQAIRLRSTAKSPGWVVVQDLQLQR